MFKAHTYPIGYDKKGKTQSNNGRVLRGIACKIHMLCDLEKYNIKVILKEPVQPIAGGLLYL